MWVPEGPYIFLDGRAPRVYMCTPLPVLIFNVLKESTQAGISSLTSKSNTHTSEEPQSTPILASGFLVQMSLTFSRSLVEEWKPFGDSTESGSLTVFPSAKILSPKSRAASALVLRDSEGFEASTSAATPATLGTTTCSTVTTSFGASTRTA